MSLHSRAPTMRTIPNPQRHHIHEAAGRKGMEMNKGAGNPPRRFFRRPRAGRACGTCHSRRVRCDAGSHGLPCTNCAAFSLQCSIPPKTKKKREGNTVGGQKRGGRSRPNGGHKHEDNLGGSMVSASGDFASLILEANQQIEKNSDDNETYAKLVKVETTEAKIEDPGRVAYLEEFSNMSILVHDYQGPAAVHYPLPPKVEKDAVSIQMNKIELEVLKIRGALSLPPRELCDELVHAYFKWVAPIVPILNRTSFMKQYYGLNSQPPILLMQAILLAGSRVCTTPLLMDSNGSPIPAATLFYQRAKALYDADYEEDRVTIVQALILMGWYWEDPGKVTRNVFYWNGLAMTIAQGCGMHRSTRNSRLSTADKRLWTRIWWTLFTRDRSVAVALGRPAHINLDHSDVEMICEDDFVEDGWQPNPLHVQFFLQYVKLCEIMDLVLLQNYSISPKAQQRNAMALTQCDLALADWLQNCPAELRWDQSRYGFWSAYLHCIYSTTSCLLHRAHLPPAPKSHSSTIATRSPAFQAACTITVIVESLIAHNELRYTPPFIIYSIFSAIMVHIYQLHSSMPKEAIVAHHERILSCFDALERVSEIWLVAKMVHDLFGSVLESLGFDQNHLKRFGYDHRQYLDEVESGFKELEVDRQSTPSSQRSGKSKVLALTPALRAHMDAALESAKPQSKTETLHDTNESLNAPQTIIQGEGQESKLFAHYIDPGEENFTWIDYGKPSTPAPNSGLNVAEWFQFFGLT